MPSASVDQDVGTQEATEQRASAGSRGAFSARLRGLALLLLLFGAIGFGADWVTSSPAICSSCHEMQPHSTTWQASAHAGVKCVECHQPPRAWHAFPLTLADRSMLLGRDILSHVMNWYDDPKDARSAGARPVSSDTCLRCHSADRQATSGFRIRIDHPEHARRNGECTSCHVSTAHPLPERGRAISLMAQCYTCHGRPEQPKAGTECDLCHPTGFELRPASHSPATWRLKHGPSAKTDPSQCPLCHDRKLCADCHGLDMPHPAEWNVPARPGGTSAHVDFSKRDSVVCARCHTGAADLCSRCHHPAWNPASGTWVARHRLAVRDKGVVSCTACHGAVFCVRCHVRRAPEE